MFITKGDYILFKFLLGLTLLGTSVASHAEVYRVPNFNDLSKVRLSSIECLAVNAYHESRSQSDIANMFVIGSVLNRVKDKRYPNDICEVVFQKSQYSWTSDGLSDKILNSKQYKRLYKLVEKFILNREVMISLSQGVDHYHTTSIKPYWIDSAKMEYVTTVDDHMFYKWIK